MNVRQLQIVSFNNPYPANYGGVIDVFYKIKYLHNLGVELYLHLFYDDRLDTEALKPYCKKIFMYKRNKSFIHLFTALPFSVASRASKQIYNNLNQTDAPILFEGLQTTRVLLQHQFKCKIFIRAHNIEHLYFYGLANSETNPLKKLVYKLQANKFKKYESVLDKADAILALSQSELKYFNQKYPSKAYYLPVFHGNEEIHQPTGNGRYALYHGDLSTADNLASATYIVSLFENLNYPLVIASSTIPDSLKNLKARYSHISLVKLEEDQQVNDLIAKAQVNILYSNQATGTKLKVFYSLYNGRFCIVNNNIVDDERILNICEVANTTEEYLQSIEKVFNTEFVYPMERIQVLEQFHPAVISKKLLDIMDEVIVKSNLNSH